MTIHDQYRKCPYCRIKTMRPKEQKDWKKGEKLGRGYFPEDLDYFFCEDCRRTWVQFKEIGGRLWWVKG